MLFAAPLGNAIALCLFAAAVSSGASLAIPRRPSPDELAATLGGGNVTVAMGVPWLAFAMMKLRGARPEAFDTLRLLVLGGARVEQSLATSVRQTLNCDVAVIYALSEFIPAAFEKDFQDLPSGCVGLPAGDTEVRIDVLDTDSTSNVGEILLRGSQASMAYVGLEDLTTTVFRDNWVRTGDMGYIDQEGRIHIVDRVAETLMVGGTRVYPSVPEARLRAHPQVADCAVAGVPHPRFGEIPVAWVVLRAEETLDAVELLNWCKKELALSDCPRDVRFVAELPRNPAGKVVKSALSRR